MSKEPTVDELWFTGTLVILLLAAICVIIWGITNSPMETGVLVGIIVVPIVVGKATHILFPP